MLQNLMLFAVRWFPVAAVAVLVCVFLWRRLWRDLPFFFLYLASALLVAALRYVSFKIGGRQFFYLYWISDLAASLLTFLPMYEVFFKRMFPRSHKTLFYRAIFPLVAVVILVLTVLTALQAQDRRAAFQIASRAFDFMRTSILVFFIALIVLMGRAWTRYDLGITLGFAIQASVALANAAVKARMHYLPSFLDTAELVAYNVSCVIWLVTFSRPEKAIHGAHPDQLTYATLDQARGWERMLKTWLTPGKGKR